MQKVIQVLRAEISQKETELAYLREALSRFVTMSGRGGVRASAEVAPNGSYVGQKVRAALRQFMETQRSATLDEIREALTQGGISWGKYPKRQVKLAVVNSPAIYNLKDDLVTLR